MCKKCAQEGLGTVDWNDRKTWYCVRCADEVLDEYQDEQLASDIRFLRKHAAHDQDATHPHTDTPTTRCPCEQDRMCGWVGGWA